MALDLMAIAVLKMIGNGQPPETAEEIRWARAFTTIRWTETQSGLFQLTPEGRAELANFGWTSTDQ